MKKKRKKMVSVTVDLDPSDFKRLKRIAKLSSHSMNTVVNVILALFVEREKN